MKVAEFLDWAMAQPRGRYELVQGEVVPMAPERALHNRVKGEVYLALKNAIARAKLPCIAYTDGMTVVVDDEHAREPDAAVQCGIPFDPDTLILEAPLVVVEITSPSSGRDDAGVKVDEYFSVPSIQHYLIVDLDEKVVVHRVRSRGGDIEKHVMDTGEIDLTPPGMRVPVAELLPDVA
jgi:Uma2 family endonuclease